MSHLVGEWVELSAKKQWVIFSFIRIGFQLSIYVYKKLPPRIEFGFKNAFKITSFLIFFAAHIVLRNVTVVVSNIDSLMMTEQMDHMNMRTSRNSFDSRLASKKRAFERKFRNELKRMFPGNNLPALGTA